MIKDVIQISEGFQSSVNIGFDLHDETKVRSFIPTAYSIDLINELFGSIMPNSIQRAQILIGAYGRGKSHIMLVLLNLLFNENNNKKEQMFERLLKKSKELDEKIYIRFLDYIKSEYRILPVIISGSSNSLTQSFLGALQQTTVSENLESLMPDTHFISALNVIDTWETEYPETFSRFINHIVISLDEFKNKLKTYDVNTYEEFEKLYPILTSGSVFNPFTGLNVVEVYEKFAEKLIKETDYKGIYIVYDEFSKYLESNIVNATISDVKLLQDFAEKCCRSGKMNLTLISHKDIANYIDERLPKDKVDGWRGVSGRFQHIFMQNNYSQIYEVIANVIGKKPEFWNKYIIKNKYIFEDIKNTFARVIDGEVSEDQLNQLVLGCYPLHPISTFILPRISEKIAQNERTLFTFLSNKGKATLYSFIEGTKEDFSLVTPDYIYDYFEALLQREPFNSEIKKIYHLAARALIKTNPNSLEGKILKTICLIYIIGQFEKLAPTVDTIVEIFKYNYVDTKKIEEAINNLISQESVVYLKRSNSYLKLKENSGINITETIRNEKNVIANKYNFIEILNDAVYENCIYPNQYNTDYDVIRYFDFKLIGSSDFRKISDLNEIIDNLDAAGIVLGIVPFSIEDLENLKNELNSKKHENKRVIFVTLKKWEDISELAIEYKALSILKATAVDDEVLAEEYEIYYDDLNECLTRYLSSFSRPEYHKAIYYYAGEEVNIQRKAHLSKLISNICEDIYSYMPIINNESLNKNILPATAISNRNKVVSALLEKELQFSLGLSGSGQEVSFMRSTLINTHLMTNDDSEVRICMENASDNMQYTIDVIKSFFESTLTQGKMSFSVLYDRLTLADFGIGLKKGVIPILLAIVVRDIKNDIVVSDANGELKISSDTINKINENPENYYVQYEEWNNAKSTFLVELEKLFSVFIKDNEKIYGKFSYIILAMNRWFMSLPRYSKELKKYYRGNGEYATLSNQELKFINSIRTVNSKPREYLLEQLPLIVNVNISDDGVYEQTFKFVKNIKVILGNAFAEMQKEIINDLVSLFGRTPNKDSLKTSIMSWYNSLRKETINHGFPGDENRFMDFCSQITNNELEFVNEVCRYISGLEIEDWSDDTIIYFNKEIASIKQMIDNYNSSVEDGKELNTNSIKIISVDTEGNERIKTFNITEYSSKATLLLNVINSDLESAGDSVTREEKRRILIELLESI